jgi:hypothetical protein
MLRDDGDDDDVHTRVTGRLSFYFIISFYFVCNKARVNLEFSCL